MPHRPRSLWLGSWLRDRYNFIKIHSSLRVTPAMADGVTQRVFDIHDLVALFAEAEKKAA